MPLAHNVTMEDCNKQLSGVCAARTNHKNGVKHVIPEKAHRWARYDMVYSCIAAARPYGSVLHTAVYSP